MNENEAILTVTPTSLKETFRMRRGEGIGARVTWRVRDLALGIALAVAAILLLQGVIVVPAVAVFGADDSKTRGLAAFTTFIWDGSLALLVYMLVKRRGASWANLGWRKPWEGEAWPLWRLARLVALALIAFWVTLGTYNALVEIAGIEILRPTAQIPSNFFDSVWIIPIIGLSIIGSAPITEELFFRGFLYGGLRRRLGVPFAALISGFLFALPHGQLGLLIPITIIGAILAIVYERTGSLWTNISLHFWFNFVSFVILVAFPGARG